MKTLYEDHNKKVLSILKDQLKIHSKELSMYNIYYTKPEIKVCNSSLEKYESEFCVYFYQSKQFIDVIESHIFRNGRQLATLEEEESWISESIRNLIDEYKG